MKQFIWIMAAVAVLLSCKKDNSGSVRVSSWQSSPQEEKILNTTLDAFRKDYPTTKAHLEVIPGNYNEKLQLMLGTGTAPDLFYIKDFFAKNYLRYDKIEPLDDYIKQDTAFDYADFYPVFLDVYKKEGKTYGIPKDFGPFVLYYNPKMFAEAGLTGPPKNWQELEAFAKKLTKDTNGDGKIDQYGMALEVMADKLMLFVLQNGGRFQDEANNLQITQPEFIEATKFYHQLYRSKIATIPSDVSMSSSEEVFGNQRCAMVISGSWFMPQLRSSFKDTPFKVAFVPAGKKQTTIAFTVSYSMPKSSKMKAEAWQVMNYLTGKRGMKQWCSSGFAMPTRRSVAAELGYLTHPDYSIFMKSAEFAQIFTVAYNDRWFDYMNAGLQSVFYQNAAIEPMLARVEKEIAPLKLK
jgi:multiple sugar transport system substrate-binding protein